jgi:hypothetical protein
LTERDLRRGYSDWRQLLANDWDRWKAAIESARKGPHVLIATSVGGNVPATSVETLLAVALTLRGARVHFLLCDELLPACQQTILRTVAPEDLVRDGPQGHICQKCWPPARRAYEALGLPVHRYSELVTPEERQRAQGLAKDLPAADMGAYRQDGLAVGEHALAGALRYFARGDLDQEPQGEAVLRRYFEAALLTVAAVRRLLAQENFATAVFNHGIYVPQGLIGETARAAKVRVVNWNPAYRSQCFIFSHQDTYHHVLMSEPTENWVHLPWNEEMEADILAYLKSRWQGTRDWIWFHEAPQEDVSALAAKLGLDLSRPIIGLLSNVIWDAQLHYPANAFPNMVAWVKTTIDYCARRPELQLVVRIHPAEVRGTIPSRQRLSDEIARAFPVLPPNVFVVQPDDPISTYALLEQCRAAIIYGTKMGVELASLGMPVIVAGEAWIRNKGLTYDAKTEAEYVGLLDRLPHLPALDEATTRRARQYAYHFFFRRMIPLPMMAHSEQGSPFRVELDGLDDLGPGVAPGLDTICDGILTGSEFIFPAERHPETVRAPVGAKP